MDSQAPASAGTGRPWGSWDRFGRWRSTRWKMMVRSFPCVASGSCRVIAAHFRYGPQCGMGLKPDDFLVYPLDDVTHQRWHAGGQPPFETQARWVASVWRRAAVLGVIQASTPGAIAAIESFTKSAFAGAAEYDAAVFCLREWIQLGEIQIGESACGSLTQF